MSSLTLTQDDIKRLLDLPALFQSIKQAFIDHRGVPEGSQRADVLLASPFYAVKAQASLGEPSTKELIQLFDFETHELKGVLESNMISTLGRALVSALATHTLARADAHEIALIGAGQLARWQLRALAKLRQIDRVFIYDLNPFVAGRFMAEMARELDAKLLAMNNLSEALFEASIVLCSTSSQLPFLFEGMFLEGSHISSLGSDELGKTELSADLLLASYYVCDDRQLTLRQGSLATLGLDETAIAADLGEVFAGLKPGRSYAKEQTLFTSIGPVWQDALVAWQVYKWAKEQELG